MRQAYLIIAHNKFEQLKFLISLLDYKEHDIFIIVDSKVNAEESTINHYTSHHYNFLCDMGIFQRIWGYMDILTRLLPILLVTLGVASYGTKEI